VRAERGVAAGLPAREAALARGIVLGQDEAIDPLLRNDFRASGLGHLLAVSGHNVMLLCALALPALAASGLGPGGRAAALVGIVAVYVPLAGAGPSLQRAGVMGVAGLVALGAGRVASRAYGLLLAAAATLALNPRVSGDPGWQLSFAAVAGILLLGRPLRAALGRAPPAAGEAGRLAAALRDGIAITLAATIATAPLLAHHFGSVPLAGLAANLAALPAVAPLMWLGLASAALAQLGPLALGPVELLGLPAGLLLRYLAWIATRFAEAGGVLSLRLSWPATAAAYGLLGGGLLAGRRAFRRARPRLTAMGGHWRLLPSGLRRGALAGSAGCLLAVAYLALLRPPAPPDRLTVSFLDVGQGDATLVQDGDGAAMLFDSGPPEARVERLLRRAGVRRLSALVATHASRDHHGGLVAVLRRYPVDLLVDGGDGTADPAFRAALAEADRRGVRRIEARAGLRLRAGGLRVVVLSPPPRPRGPPPEDPNGRAVIAVVAAGSFQLLLSADAESAALLPLALPDVDAMKVPHHGSADPGLPAVLARLRPEVAAIEVGADNPYGHPARSTLAALRAAVPHVYRTDRDGTVTLTVDGAGMRVSTAR
jgi:competence protein ComEC